MHCQECVCGLRRRPGLPALVPLLTGDSEPTTRSAAGAAQAWFSAAPSSSRHNADADVEARDTNASTFPLRAAQLLFQQRTIETGRGATNNPAETSLTT